MFKKKDFSFTFPFSQDNSFDVVPIELDGYKPLVNTMTFHGYMYRPFDEIDRYYEELIFEGNVATLPYNPTRRFDYVYRYNVYVTLNDDPDGNKYVVQNGNIGFIYEHRSSN